MSGTETNTVALTQVILRKRPSGVAMVLLDSTSKVNMLSGSTLPEYEQVFDEIERSTDIKAVCILSGKPDTFLVGADLHEIMKFTDASQGLELSTRGQRIFNRVANLKVPTVIGINGACLGGGLELALTCDKRIATDAPNTIMGLPETKLGFIPGLGGTQRLPRLVGVRKAVEMILTAEPISAVEAKEIGLVDEIVSPDDLVASVEKAALELASQGKTKRKEVDDLPPEKIKSFFAMAERSVRIRTRGKYPAQTAALAVMQKGLAEGLEAGLAEEAKLFSDLSVTDVSRNLVFLFFTTEFVRASAMSLFQKSGSPTLKTVGVVGGGMMGSTIAQLAALRGFDVIVKTLNADRQQVVVERIVERVNETLGRTGNKTAGKVIAAQDFSSLKDADIILEACAEDEQVKAKVLDEISKVAREDCVIATNTSSISVGKLSEYVQNKQSFLGLHFFHPVDKMPLVELVSTSATVRPAVAKASGFVCNLNKIPVAIKDSPSFLINRMVSSYLGEAARLGILNYPLNWIEEAATDFGMPMAPYVLSDEIGLDVTLQCAESLTEAFGRHMSPPPMLRRMIELGLVGCKTGRGIYNYNEHGKRIGFDSVLFSEMPCITSEEKPTQAQKDDLAEMLILPMIDEAARCLEEKVVRRPREIDLCMVLGMGFPPFRGGLLRYADTLGIPSIIEKLTHIYEVSEWDVQVSSYLKKLAAEGRGFYTRGAGED